MIVAVVFVLMMGVIVRMRRARGIGAAFGIERRLDLDHAGTEAAHHLLDHVVAADAQALRP